MNKEFERYLIIFLFLILIGLSGCVHKSSVAKTEPTMPTETKKTHTVTDSIGKMQGVANALGCMFAPQTCDSLKKNKESGE